MCSVWKNSERNGCSTDTVHIWPYVSKTKMCLRGSRFFWKIAKKELKCKHIFENWNKLRLLKCIFALSTWSQISTVSVIQLHSDTLYTYIYSIYVCTYYEVVNLGQRKKSVECFGKSQLTEKSKVKLVISSNLKSAEMAP